MEAIVLKRKDDTAYGASELVVFDELIAGLLTKEFFIPVFTDSKNGLRVIPFSHLVDNYKWPKKDKKVKAMIYHFMKGYSPASVENIEFYNDETIDL